MLKRGFTFIAIAGTIALAGGVAASAGAKGGATECNAVYSHTTFHGGVVVNTGDTCVLKNVRIDGGLTVTGGTFKVENSVIRGGWRITGGTGMSRQCGNNVNGGLRVMNASGRYVFGESLHSCVGGRINGGVRFVNNTGSVIELDGYHVNGRIVDTGNSVQDNEIEGNTVHGSAKCANNTPPIRNNDGGPNSYTGTNAGCPA